MIKYSLSLIVLIITYCNINAQCPPSGSYIAANQEAVDEFLELYPNCTELAGTLTIQDVWLSSDVITNISAFSNLTAINGGLVISGTQLLDDLSELENLVFVGF